MMDRLIEIRGELKEARREVAKLEDERDSIKREEREELERELIYLRSEVKEYKEQEEKLDKYMNKFIREGK